MKRKRAALIMLLLLAALVGGTGLWWSAQRRQYALNRRLIAALIRDDSKQAVALVNAGADPNTHYMPTPLPSLPELATQLLHRSSPTINDSPTAFLIACGAPWNHGDAHLFRPDVPQLVQAMAVHGANVNAWDEREKWTALMWAIRGKRRNTVRLLLEYGADANTKDNDGWTPLLTVMRFDATPDVVRGLLEHGADVNAKDENGWTPLIAAIKFDAAPDVVRLLLAHGADPNLGDNHGLTSLTLAHQRPDLIALLRQAGAKK